MFDSKAIKNLTGALGAIIAALAIFGYVYTLGSALTNLDNKIDRNCRFLAIVEADSRYLIVQHIASDKEAKTFREIFTNAIRDTCG